MVGEDFHILRDPINTSTKDAIGRTITESLGSEWSYFLSQLRMSLHIDNIRWPTDGHEVADAYCVAARDM